MNSCPKCGFALQPGQDFCTNCGNQINNVNQQPNNNMNQPMNNDMNQNMNMNQPMNNGMNQNMNMNQPMNNGMNQNVNMNQPVNNGMNQNMNQPVNNGMNQQPTKKQNNNTMIIIIAAIAVVAVVACVAIVLLTGKDNGDKDNNKSNSGNDSGNVQEVSDSTASTITYQGFTFNVPSGYETTEDVSSGMLVIHNDTLAIGIMPAYGTTFEEYRKELALQLNVDAASLSKVINGTEYLLVPVQESSTGRIATLVVYDTKDSALMLATVANSKFEVATEEQLKVMDSIMTSTKKTSTFAAPSEEETTIEKPEFKDLFEIIK